MYWCRKQEVDEKISRAWQNRSVRIMPDGRCIWYACLKGGVFFMCELAKRITVPVTMDFMSVSSYGAGTESSGVVRIIKDLDEPLEGKECPDRGGYHRFRQNPGLSDRGIKAERIRRSIHLCTLLDKPERRVKKQVKVDYTCFTIPDEFVVGYGLDYDQKYRNLPYIGVVEQDRE